MLAILSDIHGCFYTMLRLLARCPDGTAVILNGDLIDRVPHSRQVVEWAMVNSIPTVCGNHESLALAFYGRNGHCNSDYRSDDWLNNGGDRTVPNWPTIDRRRLTGPQAAYAEYLGGRLPDDVLDWMEQ